MTYDARNADELLASLGVAACPSARDVRRQARRVRQGRARQRRRRGADAEVEDSSSDGEEAVAPCVGEGMVVRRVLVRARDVVFFKGIIEASEGLAAVFAERGGDSSSPRPPTGRPSSTPCSTALAGARRRQTAVVGRPPSRSSTARGLPAEGIRRRGARPCGGDRARPARSGRRRGRGRTSPRSAGSWEGRRGARRRARGGRSTRCAGESGASPRLGRGAHHAAPGKDRHAAVARSRRVDAAAVADRPRQAPFARTMPRTPTTYSDLPRRGGERLVQRRRGPPRARRPPRRSSRSRGVTGTAARPPGCAHAADEGVASCRCAVSARAAPSRRRAPLRPRRRRAAGAGARASARRPLRPRPKGDHVEGGPWPRRTRGERSGRGLARGSRDRKTRRRSSGARGARGPARADGLAPRRGGLSTAASKRSARGKLLTRVRRRRSHLEGEPLLLAGRRWLRYGRGANDSTRTTPAPRPRARARWRRPPVEVEHPGRRSVRATALATSSWIWPPGRGGPARTIRTSRGAGRPDPVGRRWARRRGGGSRCRGSAPRPGAGNSRRPRRPRAGRAGVGAPRLEGLLSGARSRSKTHVTSAGAGPSPPRTSRRSTARKAPRAPASRAPGLLPRVAAAMRSRSTAATLARTGASTRQPGMSSTWWPPPRV